LDVQEIPQLDGGPGTYPDTGLFWRNKSF
jgi:hypothetical protein